VNIAAVMAALEVWDLDRSAKHALVVVACRADAHTGVARVSIPRVAADMKVHYATAKRALERLVDAEYLTVDKWAGATSRWMLTPRVVRGVTPRIVRAHPALQMRGDPAHSPRGKESLDKNKERAAASLAHGANGGAEENPPPRGEHFAPGSGYLEDFTGLAARNGRVDLSFIKRSEEP
jgi:hypothetical protein